MSDEQTVNLDFLNDKEANAAFNETEGINPGGPPAGIYVVEISEVEVKLSKAGNRMVVWSLIVAQGPYTGRFISPFRNMLHNDDDDSNTKKEKFGKLKGAFAFCGVPLATYPGLVNAMERLRGRFLRVRTTPQIDKKTEQLTQYFNTNIQAHIETLEAAEGEGKPVF